MAKSEKNEGGGAGRGGLMMAAGAAAVGLMAGLAANAGRKAAVQVADALTGDWSDVLKAEHLLIAEVFDLIDQTKPRDVARRRRHLARLRALIDRHAFQEENVVYPYLALSDPQGPAARLAAEHAEVKTLLFDLERTGPGDPRWMGLAQRLRSILSTHMREEEDHVFPRLRRSMTPAQETELATLLGKSGVKLA